jgi:hypothetical protein
LIYTLLLCWRTLFFFFTKSKFFPLFVSMDVFVIGLFVEMTVQNLTITTSTNRRNIRLVIFRVLDTLCGIFYSSYLNYIHLINPRFQERRMIEKYFLYILPGSSTKQPESTIKFKYKILFSTLLIKGFRN